MTWSVGESARRLMADFPFGHPPLEIAAVGEPSDLGSNPHAFALSLDTLQWRRLSEDEAADA